MTIFQNLQENFRNNLYFRWASLAIISAVSAYLLASLTSFASSSIAALTAALIVQGSVHESVKEGLLQLVGVTLGAMLGLILFVSFDGLNVIALLIAMVAGFVFAYLVGLTINAAVSMVVPIIVIVGGQTLSVYTLEERILGVLIGVAVALVASHLTKKGKPHMRITEEITSAHADIVSVLNSVARHTKDGSVTQTKVTEWETSLNETIKKLHETQNDAKNILANVKYSPFIKEEETQHLIKTIEEELTIVLATMQIVQSFRVATTFATQTQKVVPLPSGGEELQNRETFYGGTYEGNIQKEVPVELSITPQVQEQVGVVASLVAQKSIKPHPAPSGSGGCGLISRANELKQEAAKEIKSETDNTQELLLNSSLTLSAATITDTVAESPHESSRKL